MIIRYLSFSESRPTSNVDAMATRLDNSYAPEAERHRTDSQVKLIRSACKPASRRGHDRDKANCVSRPSRMLQKFNCR
jgi:hypothetical protein